MELKIVNVVTTADLQQSVDIKQIAQLEHTIHDSEIYGGRVVYINTPEMYGKVSIFKSGKMISIGSKSPKEAEKDLRFVSDKLAELDLIKRVNLSTQIRNIVSLLILSTSVDLESLSIQLDGIYEPEQFPGMILRQKTPKVTYLIFNSGKIVITGGKSISEVQQAASIIKEMISTCS